MVRLCLRCVCLALAASRNVYPFFLTGGVVAPAAAAAVDSPSKGLIGGPIDASERAILGRTHP